MMGAAAEIAGVCPAEQPVLVVKDLHVAFRSQGRLIEAVNGVNFAVNAKECLGIVGESGSGKSVTALALLCLLRGRNVQQTGIIEFQGQDLRRLPEKALRDIRGREISMIFQDPMSSLNPVLTVGRQITEVLERHLDLKGRQARKRAIELLEIVKIPAASQRVDDYPHQLSGGMRQRVMIAIAIACNPKVLIADEPTTALDVTVQAQMITMLDALRHEFGMALILITHDMAVVAAAADKINVMYAGRVVEAGSTNTIFYSSSHPYTQALLHSMPRVDRPTAMWLRAIDGMPPNPANLPRGCAFRPRCQLAYTRCLAQPTLFKTGTPDHQAACWLVSEQSQDQTIRHG
jgi:oligopeptide transport system ATP-binding protein